MNIVALLSIVAMAVAAGFGWDAAFKSNAIVNPTSAALVISFLGFAVFGVWVAVRKSDGVGAPATIFRKTGMRAIAKIPKLKEIRFTTLAPDRRHPAGYLVEQPMSDFADALRALQDTLLAGRPDARSGAVVAISSVDPGVGNTSLSLSLARMGAMSGFRTILLECNRRRPALPKLLAVNPNWGLFALLSDGGEWRSALHRDCDSAADIVFAGPSDCRSDELSAPTMQSLINALRDSYDLILMDSPPLFIADAERVASYADHVFIVVKEGKTAPRAIRVAARSLMRFYGKTPSVVINFAAKGGSADALPRPQDVRSGATVIAIAEPRKTASAKKIAGPMQ